MKGFRRRSRKDAVESHLLVDHIQDGYLIMRNGEGPRLVLEVTGTNFELASEHEQLGLITKMGELLNSLPEGNPIQILVRSRPYDPDEYFDTLEGWRSSWTAKRDLREQRLEQYKTKVRSIAGGGRLKRRQFYIVIPYTPPEHQTHIARLQRKLGRNPSVNMDEAVAQLRQKEQHIRKMLTRMGIKVHRLTSRELEELFFYFWDPALAKIWYQRGPNTTTHRLSASTLDNAPITIEPRVGEAADIRNIYQPPTLEVKPDYVQSRGYDDTYCAVLYVQDYPREVTSNWLRDVLSLDYHLDVSLHVTPLDPERARSKLNDNERELAGTLAAVAHDVPSARKAGEKLEDIAIVNAEFRNKGKWFRLSVTITVSASSLDELNRAVRTIQAHLTGPGFLSFRAEYRQEQGLNSTLPQAVNQLGMTRGMPTSNLAAAYPFSKADQVDPGGYLFGVVGGIDSVTSPLVLNPRTWDNPHMVVLGWTGGGKSANVKEKLLYEWIAGSGVAVIDPRSEYRSLAEHCDGEIIPLHLGSSKHINIWDLPRKPGVNPFVHKVAQLLNFWRLALGYLPDEEARLLEGGIMQAYARKDILPDEPSTWDNEPPVTSDFQQGLWERYGHDDSKRQVVQSLIDRLDKFTKGYLAPMFNQKTSVDLSNDFLVFDVQQAREQPDLLPLVYWLILNHLRTWMMSSKRRRTVAIDEFWSLAQHPEGTQFVNDMSRTARHANTQLILVTQSVAEMLDSPQAAAILSNMGMTILHKQHADHIKRVMETFILTDEETRHLQNAPRGTCLAITPEGLHVFVQTMVGYQPEHELYCTEPFKCGHPHGNGTQTPLGSPV